MTGAAVLYTPAVLGLATSLARWPWREDLPLRGEARSPACGSTVRLALETDSAGRIAELGLRASACAIGQAAAALFAEGAVGKTRGEIAEAEAALSAWLADQGAEPAWPGLAVLTAARSYPARHGAILLAWKAALAALPSAAERG